MALNSRKQMTQFIKEENISGTGGLKHVLLLYVMIQKSLYYSLYSTLHLFPKTLCQCVKVTPFSVMINPRQLGNGVHSLCSIQLLFPVFPRGWAAGDAPQHSQTLRAGRGRPPLTPPRHWDTPAIKNQPEQRAACSLLCYLDKMLLILILLSLKLEFYFNKHKIKKYLKFQISLKV